MSQALCIIMNKYTHFKSNVSNFQNITQASFLKQIFLKEICQILGIDAVQQLCAICVKMSFAYSMTVFFKN